MVTKLDELYEQRMELQRQIHVLDSKIDERMELLRQLHILDSQINEEKKEQREHENLCKQYKKSFLKDIEIFNKETLEKEIVFGIELRTPHYIIHFTQTDNNWKAGVIDLHKSKFIVFVSLYKEEIKTVKQALDDIADVIVEYEFENDFNGVR